MTRLAVDQFLYLLDQAFEGHEEHALLINLKSLTADDWYNSNPGGGRSAAGIVGHLVACKLMYEHYAFGEARLTWMDPLAEALPGLAIDPRLTIDGIQGSRDQPRPDAGELMRWLHESHRRLRQSVADLDDGGLLQERRLNWGGTVETRWIISVMIQHDLYHAGEINHIRALLQRNDRWAWELEQEA
jgi:DinB superfamily